jgi:hypothetical protein
MQIEITKQVQQVEIIEAELPYYYKHDLASDYGNSIIYGKIEENSHTSIQETYVYDVLKYEIEKEEHESIKNSGLSCYFKEEHKSTQKEFEDVKNRCLSFLKEI